MQCLSNTRALRQMYLANITAFDDPALITVLSTLAPCPLESITIEAHFSAVLQFLRGNVSAFNQVFSPPAFALLRKLELLWIGLGQPEQPHSVLARVLETLPALADRGIVVESARVRRAWRGKPAEVSSSSQLDDSELTGASARRL